MTVEEFVLAVVASGLADLRLVHLPAAFRSYAPPNGHRRVSFAAACGSGLVPPYAWPTVCGLSGVVYSRDVEGCFGETTICATCVRVSSCGVVDSPVASAA